ncbi:hypothetical protein [Mameliella sediminis]|uniref:hypothetical protein n=1 Tax=Mameliella sediminis TaxID=2836866 RepID=UPI001C476B29|nr:hypothetical protein [Mameliella sediminis]MBY6112861.1 hypothetical protein [Antarctobacter heliothermus]MBY6143791.1 hypothetical protein [Mameliella alba]MBV7394143.1 hypothetical protein [Mameliella sediminis]MBY6162445.1 hypothetical protein [Mameliella alba]MBY6170919.1 hypothetical protein [Mameliella alba]
MHLIRLAICLAALPAALVAQEPGECIGHDLNSPQQGIALLSPTHTWTLYNLGPGQVQIRASNGATLPGPAPSSEPSPVPFQGEVGVSYELSLAAPGLTIVYVCP